MMFELEFALPPCVVAAGAMVLGWTSRENASREVKKLDSHVGISNAEESECRVLRCRWN